MTLQKRSLLVSFVLLVVSGCSLFEAAEPFDESSDAGNAGGVRDAGVSDTGGQQNPPDDGRELLLGECMAPLHAAGLEADWSTANTIRWSWEYSGSDAALDTFVLVVGSSEDNVRDLEDVEIFGPERAGELTKVTGEHRRTWTVSYGHEPVTTYYARLVAVQPDRCTSSSNIASATTGEDVLDEFVIFSETPTEGISIPREIVLSNRTPYRGDFHYEWEAECEGGEESCYEIVRRQNLGLKVDIPREAFDRAFLEFAVQNEGSAVGQSEQVRLQIRVAGQSTWWNRTNFVTTAPSDDYRIVQIPLSDFFRDGAPLTWDDLTAGVLYEFGFGGTWSAGTMVSFDEVRIRY